MAEIETEIKKWGNSLGVRLPRNLKREGIQDGDHVRLTVEKSVAPSSNWGILNKYRKRRRVDYDQFKAEERRKERARDKRLGLR